MLSLEISRLFSRLPNVMVPVVLGLQRSLSLVIAMETAGFLFPVMVAKVLE